MAGLKVVSVKVKANGELDMDDLRAKAEQYKDQLAAFMVRQLSTSPYLKLIYHIDHVPFDLRCFRGWRSRGLQDHT